MTGLGTVRYPLGLDSSPIPHLTLQQDPFDLDLTSELTSELTSHMPDTLVSLRTLFQS